MPDSVGIRYGHLLWNWVRSLGVHMSTDTEFPLAGWVPESDNLTKEELSRHWIYEDDLKDRMVALTDSKEVDLRPFSSPRHNQRWTNSCVANAVVKALEIKEIMKNGGHDGHTDLSVMEVYYLAREITWPPTTQVDKGTFISHACDVLRRFGVCPDKDWPWVPSKINESPTWMAMRKAYLHKIEAFYKIYSTGGKRIEEVIRCLHAGNPVVFGTTVGSNWFGYKKGQVLQAPSKIEGRHATVILGWRDGHFIGENSWGENWGDRGFYLMDPSVIAHPNSQDFWVIQEGYEKYKETPVSRI